MVREVVTRPLTQDFVVRDYSKAQPLVLLHDPPTTWVTPVPPRHVGGVGVKSEIGYVEKVTRERLNIENIT